MSKRGRVSGAELAVARLTAPIETVQRPDAPYELTDEQADEWRSVVGRLPADWFPRETWPMLAQYCRHVVAARRIGQLIAANEKGDVIDVDMLDRLYKMQEREGRAISSLATRMRMTQQSTYDKSKKKGLSVSERPWE